MKLILGAALVVLVALLGSRKTFTKVKLPLGARHIYLTGTEYILVGWCLGSQMLDLLDTVSVKELSPLLHLALGWIGLMFGSQLDLSGVKRFPKQYFWVTTIQAVSTILVCVATMTLLFLFADWRRPDQAVILALVLAAIAVPTGQSSLALVVGELKLRRGWLTDLLSYIAGIDMLFGVAVLGAVFCYMRADVTTSSPIVAGLVYLVLSVGMGAVMGVVLHVLTRARCTQEELMLFTIGVVVFSAGAAVYLGISPLFVTTIGGVVVANAKGAKVRILRAMSTLEKPFYIVVLIFGGAQLNVFEYWQTGLIFAALYVASRTTGKLVGGLAASFLVTKPNQLPRSLGMGLVSQGGVAAAMALSYYTTFENRIAGIVLFIAFVAIIVNELLGPAFVRSLIEKRS